MNESLFKINRHMIETPRLALLRQDAREGLTIVGVSNNAVTRRDMETLAMAADANRQPGRRIDALDEQVGAALDEVDGE